MSQRILCYLPAERVSLCNTVFSAQAIPVVDLCYSDRSRVPNGAWVRTRSKRDIPGKGPVILAAAIVAELFIVAIDRRNIFANRRTRCTS